MRLQVSVDAWTAQLFAVLALSPLAGCGGSLAGTGGGGTTSDTSGGSGGGGGQTGSTTATTIPCEDPQPVIVHEADTGFVRCKGGWTHRASIESCEDTLTGTGTCAGTEGFDTCASDADCNAAPHGYCALGYNPVPVCSCRYGCVQDSDCASGHICECGNGIGTCVSAKGCKSDADCDVGLCATYQAISGCGTVTAYACQSPDDECTANSECGSSTFVCTMVDDHRECGGPPCVTGRPFLVEGEARLARVEARGDWRANILSPTMVDLDAPAREALAARWTKVGLMEHASVAAFARFVLQLLALGAPADLVRDAQAAIADETRHAEQCFALASAYAAAPLGPGPLAIDRATESSDLRSVLVTTIHEGCVGETIAAIEAAELAEWALDPSVRSVLLGIAEDETRHAELAWRFVRWALSEAPSLTAVAKDAFADALSAPRGRVAGGAGDPRLLAHGAPGEGLSWEIRRSALECVVGLCARAMLASVAVAPDEPPPTRRVGRAARAAAAVS